ncbi:MAG: hypothetical protein ACK5O7_06490 [Holosporales bacterium]
MFLPSFKHLLTLSLLLSTASPSMVLAGKNGPTEKRTYEQMRTSDEKGKAKETTRNEASPEKRSKSDHTDGSTANPEPGLPPFNEPPQLSHPSDFLKLIEKANAGDAYMQDFIITWLDNFPSPLDITGKIDFLAWNPRLEDWIVKDWRRVKVISLYEPHLLRNNPHILKEIHERAAANDAEAHICTAHLIHNGFLAYVSNEAKLKAVYEHYSAAAHADHPGAMYMLGSLLQEGLGPGDPADQDREALHWFRKAAEKGIVPGMCSFAWMVSERRGGTDQIQDHNYNKEAFEWLQKAIEVGSTHAFFLMGLMLNGGLGLTGDHETQEKQAIDYFRQAAEKGHIGAMTTLGHVLKEEGGIAGNQASLYLQTLQWLRIAAERGSIDAIRELAKILYDEDGIPETHEDLYAETIGLLRKAAEASSTAAMTELGWMLKEGYGMAQNQPEALYWLRKAAEQGDISAMRALGSMLTDSGSLEMDRNERNVEAAKWLRLVANEGGIKDAYNIARILLTSSVITESKASDDKEAVEWLLKAAQGGHTTAMYKLAEMYRANRGVEGSQQDKMAAALRWLYKAADNDDSNAMLSLSQIYYSGQGVPIDHSEAYYWFFKKSQMLRITSPYFSRVSSVPLDNTTSGLSEEHMASFEILKTKIHEVSGEYLGLTLLHNPEEQPSDLMTAGRLPKMPGFASLYEPLSDVLQRTAFLMEKLKNQNMLVSVIKRKNSDTTPLVLNPNNLHLKYAEHKLKDEERVYDFVTIGEENVKNAQEIMDLISGTHPLWINAQDALDKVKRMQQEAQHQSRTHYRILEARTKAAKELQEMLTHLPQRSAAQEEELSALCAAQKKLNLKLKLCTNSAEKIMRDEEHIQAVQDLRDELKAAVIQDVGRRNSLFREGNPWIDNLSAF